jgi:hypothetical protein
MALKIYYLEDIGQGVRATLSAMLLSFAANEGKNVEHMRGAIDFARAQVALYNLDWPELIAQIEQTHRLTVPLSLKTLLTE